MKVKEINRTANIAWSPAPQYPIYLAAGTAAQQLDATFSTNAALEIFSLNLSDSDTEMPLKGSIPSAHRFHKLVWGPHGMDNSLDDSSGLLVGGTDNGVITIYNANKIISGEKDNLVFSQTEKHTGAVQALDFNPFQSNLLASGASDSEIFIWDMNKPDSPLTPGAKTQPHDNISCLAWNRQVQHILASASPGGRCVVWDLRKNEPIIKVSDQSAMIRCKAVEWHPDVATQMILASEDDRYPVIQVWDLRFATSPMKVLQGHERGILSIAWCRQDPDLLLSCGKDNHIYCWDPNTGPAGEIVYELPITSQWTFDVAWCPRNPGMVCTSSFDGHVSVFSLMGGSMSGQELEQQKVSSAFDMDDPFAAAVHAHQQAQQQQKIAASSPLKKPPKWLRRPCGANFGFGGKLISFGHTKESAPQVHISQVTTEQELVNRSNELEGALVSGNFIEYCKKKYETSTHKLEKTLWSFLKINFESEPRKHFLGLLGYDPTELSNKVATSKGLSGSGGGIDAAELAQKMQLLGAEEQTNQSKDGVFSSGQTTPSVTGSKTPLSESGSLTEGALAFDAIAAGGPLMVDTGADAGISQTVVRPQPFEISTDDDTDGLISQALLTGNFEVAVDVCVGADRMADAFLLAIAGGPDLLARIQKRYFEKSKSNVARLMSVVINRDWQDVVERCVLHNWREALAALVTYAKPEEFTALCDLLGQRLEQEGEKFCANAMVCYICAGNVEKFVACWTRSMPVEPSPLDLQNLIEKVMLLKKAVESERRQVIDSGSTVLAEKLSKYADILASQGSLQTAMGYLMTCSDQANLGVLKDRLFHAQHPSHLTTSTAPPPFPFPRFNVLAEPAPQKQMQQPAYGAQQPPVQRQQRQEQSSVNATFQPTAPPKQTNFYNPVASAQPTPPPPQPAYNQQVPYYSVPNQPTASVTQPSWSSPPPTSLYQPPSANVNSMPPPPPTLYQPRPHSTSPMPPPPSGSYVAPAQVQTPPPVNLYNPVGQPVVSYGSSGSPGAPFSGSTPIGPPPTVPPLSGPPPTGTPPSGGPVPTDPPPLSGAWTDMHMMRGKKPLAYTPPPPITAPIFGGPGQQQPPQQQQQPFPSGAPVGPPGYGMPGMIPQGGGPPGAPPSFGQQPPPPAPQQAPVREVMKGPIPAEHVALQETFDGLVTRCRNTANNPHTKRKLDDVNKRLEALYDKLREQKLPPQILEGLHEVARACQGAEYPRGLVEHTKLISSGSFSEISTFMPGLKSLMQVATQLQV